MSILRILAPSAEGARLQWVRCGDSGQLLAQGGEAQLQAVDSDHEIELILAAERVLPIPVEVSPEQLSRLSEENLPWLAEPFLSQDIERLHIVRGPYDKVAGLLTLLAVEHAWLSALLHRLGEKQLRPTRILAENHLIPWQKGQWTLLLKSGGGFMRTGEQSGLILDQGQPLPVVLRLALKTGPAPEEIRIYREDVACPDIPYWSQELGLPVHDAGSWTWQDASPGTAAPDLARGPYAPPGRTRDLLRRLRLSLTLLAGVIALALFGHLIASLFGFLETSRLNAAIEGQLRTAFPRTQVILDPVRQMQQNVEQLRQNTGEATSADFLPLLAKTSTLVGKDLSGRVEHIRYEPRVLTLEVVLPDAASLDKLKREMSALAVKWENLPASGSAVRIRMSIAP